MEDIRKEDEKNHDWPKWLLAGLGIFPIGIIGMFLISKFYKDMTTLLLLGFGITICSFIYSFVLSKFDDLGFPILVGQMMFTGFALILLTLAKHGDNLFQSLYCSLSPVCVTLGIVGGCIISALHDFCRNLNDLAKSLSNLNFKMRSLNFKMRSIVQKMNSLKLKIRNTAQQIRSVAQRTGRIAQKMESITRS